MCKAQAGAARPETRDSTHNLEHEFAALLRRLDAARLAALADAMMPKRQRKARALDVIAGIGVTLVRIEALMNAIDLSAEMIDGSSGPELEAVIAIAEAARNAARAGQERLEHLENMLKGGEGC